MLRAKPRRPDRLGKPRQVGVRECAHLMAVEVEDSTGRAARLQGNHRLGAVPRIAGDIGVAEGEDVLDHDRPLFDEAGACSFLRYSTQH